MQTCSRCNASSPDTAKHCVNCAANLAEFSVQAVALKQYRENPRVTSIRIEVAHDACSSCFELHGTYEKDAVPLLPHQGCSHSGGCRCNYAPYLNEIYP